MRIKILFAFTILALLMTGRAPGIPELRNPEAPQSALRAQMPVKRAVT